MFDPVVGDEIKVWWLDSSHGTHWKEASTARSGAPVECISWGRVLAVVPNSHITIAGHYSDGNLQSDNPEQVLGEVTIPKCSIRDIQRIVTESGEGFARQTDEPRQQPYQLLPNPEAGPILPPSEDPKPQPKQSRRTMRTPKPGQTPKLPISGTVENPATETPSERPEAATGSISSGNPASPSIPEPTKTELAAEMLKSAANDPEVRESIDTSGASYRSA